MILCQEHGSSRNATDKRVYADDGIFIQLRERHGLETVLHDVPVDVVVGSSRRQQLQLNDVQAVCRGRCDRGPQPSSMISYRINTIRYDKHLQSVGGVANFRPVQEQFC
jgi:hypothetical protein